MYHLFTNDSFSFSDFNSLANIYGKVSFTFKNSAIFPPEMCFKDMCELMGLKEICSRIENV